MQGQNSVEEAGAANWRYPPPRSGWAGQWDRFVGPGADAVDVALMVGGAVVGGLAIVAYVGLSGAAWTPLQIIGAVIVAGDIVGGVAANATSAAKRWYHRAGQKPLHHLSFVAVHIVHLLVLMALFLPGAWDWLMITYGYLMLSALAIVSAPRSRQRPVALLAVVGGLMLNSYMQLAPAPGLEWLIPALYLKLLVSHLLHEEPYQDPA